MSIKSRILKLENILSIMEVVSVGNIFFLNGEEFTKEEFKNKYPNYDLENMKVIEWV